MILYIIIINRIESGDIMDNAQLKEYKKLKEQKEKQLRRENEYNKSNYERMGIVVEKGQKDIILKHVKECGYSSFNAYIKDLIKKDMGINV